MSNFEDDLLDFDWEDAKPNDEPRSSDGSNSILRDSPNYSSHSITTNRGYNLDTGIEESEETESDSYFHRGCIIGPAGTGKTTLLKTRILEDPTYGVLCATTGIAAINLSTEECQVKTINGLLGYYDTESLMELYRRGSLVNRLMALSENYRHVVLDEMSMLGKSQLDVLDKGFVEANKQLPEDRQLGLILTGDFLQLPPVKDKYCFESDCWSEYEKHREILTTNYRQVDDLFKRALNYARRGEGRQLAYCLQSHSEVSFHNRVDYFFEGTTIYATNEEVDKHNGIRLDDLVRKGNHRYIVKSFRWGDSEPEWKKIPMELELAEGALIMILNNNPDGYFANGSTGNIVSYVAGLFQVQLKDNRGLEVAEIGKITRRKYTKYKREIHGPIEDKMTFKEWRATESTGSKGRGATYKGYLAELTETCRTMNETNSTPSYRDRCKPFYDYEKEQMVIGEVTFYPLRLAWATTVHKSQGLTLDNVQIDYVGSGRGKGFMSQVGMSYVSLSRVRSPKGLRIIGTPLEMEKKTNVSGKVLRWA